MSSMVIILLRINRGTWGRSGLSIQADVSLLTTSRKLHRRREQSGATVGGLVIVICGVKFDVGVHSARRRAAGPLA